MVCKQSLVAFVLRLVFGILLADFFSIACLWMPISIITVECLLIGVQSQGVFLLETLLVINSACNLSSWPELLFLWYVYTKASQFDISPFAFYGMWLRT